jgi:uncharacterized protein YprB with RNaseH-like and TPR domain
MNIKDKLIRLDKSGAKKEIKNRDTDYSSEWINEFQTELDAKIISEKNSFIILKENFYPIFSHDYFINSREKGFISKNFDKISADPSAFNLDLTKTIFIDLETTGLSGGTGTYAFLVGFGYIELDHVVVKQYLLPDFQHEWLLLKYVENNFINKNFLISFNGKSFDVPLLKTRFVLNRMETVLDELNHIDVLHTSRRIWKTRLNYCDLQNLEYAVLGKERFNDVPGEMIPQIYFEYIRKRKANLFKEVLEHNYYDIVNMILLSIKTGEIVDDPLQNLDHIEDIYTLAKYYFQNKFLSDAIPLLDFVSKNKEHNFFKKESIFLQSLSYKKSGDVKKASQLMQSLIKENKDHPGAIEELLKFYEHKEKNFDAALELIDDSLKYIEILDQLDRPSSLVNIKESLLYRRNRVLKKKQKALKED